MQTREVDATAVQALLAAAVAAPSIHNTQPWRFRLDPESRSIVVRIDRERSLPGADPEGRAQHLSVGAAVFNLRMAAAHLGWNPVVRLLPATDGSEPPATVRLTPAPPSDGRPTMDDGLYEAIGRRHTSRMPFTGRPVAEQVVAELIGAARVEGAHLDVPDIMGTRRLLRLTRAAEDRNARHPGRAAETRAWITAPGADSPYGIPLPALGPRDASGRLPVRDFTGAPSVPRLPPLPFERHAQVALLWTARDRRQDWLRAGQALERVLLTATRRGVRTSMLHQAMEWRDLRAAMAGPRRGRCPQMLIRFGYGPEGGRTPRAIP
ncbi:nitroreductase family protein [Streptomyces sp. NPDC050703]|uniref:Acg family FMN-binding oxidoreductase n=1 Tax=Streptomyces sp. NPDC050703 TaxID=3157218 RepID=UPI003416077C